jgi:uncharacterized membrane protein
MSSPANVRDHPIHPILVCLPIGLWMFALVSDLVFAADGAPAWDIVAFYCIAAGIVGALLAAVPGFIDYLSIEQAAMKRIATYHLLFNLGAVVLFAVNLWLRLNLTDPGLAPLIMSIIGIVAVGIAGWLGGEMVYVKRMAVQAVEELNKKVQQKDKTSRRRAA